METIKNKIFDNIKAKKITLEDKRFINCSFSGFDGAISLKDIVFYNCEFKNCNLTCSIDDVVITGAKISQMTISKSNIYNLTIEESLITFIELSNSFTSLLSFNKNEVENMRVNKITIDNSFLIYNEFKNMGIYSSMVLNSSFIRCCFKELSNVIEKTYFDDACCFKLIDFSSLKECNANNLKNIVFAKFKSCKNSQYLRYTTQCPEEGSFIGYKKCLYEDNEKIKSCIVTLKICKDAKRLGNNSSGKCRCSKAEVLSIEDMDGNKITEEKAQSINSQNFIYEIGKIVEPINGFDENEEEECSSGIHFFLSKREARNYW